MAPPIYHFIASSIVAFIFGFLIDTDHGHHKDTTKCLFTLKEDKSLDVGRRGIFHKKNIWILGVCTLTSWTLHLLIDGILNNKEDVN
jgi:hypothetical protein